MSPTRTLQNSKTFGNEYRRRKINNEKTWAENNIYRSLKSGERRNTSESDYRKRKACIIAHYNVKHVTTNEKTETAPLVQETYAA